MVDDTLDLVLIIQSDAFGGTERHTLELVKHIHTHKIKSAFLYCGEGFNNHIAESSILASAQKVNSKVRNVTLTDVNIWRNKFKENRAKKALLVKPSYFSVDLKFLFLVKAYYPDLIVIEHSLPPRRPPLPRIGPFPKIGYWRLKNELLRYFFAIPPKKVIVVSERARDESKEHTYYKKINVCGNGVDTKIWIYNEKKGEEFRARNNISPDVHLFGCVGNLFPVKSFHIAIQALSLLSEEHKNQCALCIIGVGHEDRNLKGLVEKLGLTNVFFLGKQMDMPSAYSAINTLLITSTSESAPLALLEATACNCDVLSSNVGNCAEVIHEFDNGAIIDSHDPKAWSKSIEMHLSKSVRKKDFENSFKNEKFKNKYDTKKTMRNLIESIMD